MTVPFLHEVIQVVTCGARSPRAYWDFSHLQCRGSMI